MLYDEPEERALFYKSISQNSDKVYLLQMVESFNKPGTWVIYSCWGPRKHSGWNQKQVKIKAGRLAAEKEFGRLLSLKLRKGYEVGPRHCLPLGYPSLQATAERY